MASQAALAPVTGTNGNLETKKKLYSFREAQHHHVVEVAAHIVSPLTASLTIFMLHKRGQLVALKAAGRAAYLRLKLRGSSPSPSVNVSHGHFGRSSSAVAAEQRRAFHNFADVKASTSKLHQAPLFAHARAGLIPSLVGTSSGRSTHYSHLAPRSVSASSTSRLAAVVGGAAAGTGVASAVDAATPGIEQSLTQLVSPELPTHTLEVLQKLYSPEEAQLLLHHLTDWPSVKFVEAGLHYLHDTAHLPWWATIVGTTLVLRTLLAPVNILLLKNTLLMKTIHPRVAELKEIMKSETTTDQEKLKAAEDLKTLFKEKGCSPFKGCLMFPFFLPPTILSIFGAINNVSLTTPAMANEGCLWFTDLLLPDSTNLLPILSAVTWLLNIESGAGVYYHSHQKLQLIVRSAAYLCWALAAPIPSGVLLFWTTSNVFAITRGYITRFDKVRKALGIPLSSEIAKLTHLPKNVS
jgi:YidC/Oxa1 family membrane protein insertase